MAPNVAKVDAYRQLYLATLPGYFRDEVLRPLLHGNSLRLLRRTCSSHLSGLTASETCRTAGRRNDCVLVATLDQILELLVWNPAYSTKDEEEWSRMPRHIGPRSPFNKRSESLFAKRFQNLWIAIVRHPKQQ